MSRLKIHCTLLACSTFTLIFFFIFYYYYSAIAGCSISRGSSLANRLRVPRIEMTCNSSIRQRFRTIKFLNQLFSSSFHPQYRIRDSYIHIFCFVTVLSIYCKQQAFFFKWCYIPSSPAFLFNLPFTFRNWKEHFSICFSPLSFFFSFSFYSRFSLLLIDGGNRKLLD